MAREHAAVMGTFLDSHRAGEAYRALKGAGFASQDIGVLLHGRDEIPGPVAEIGTRARQGTMAGLVGGGVIGGLAGWLGASGARGIPVIGSILAAGVLVTTLVGAGIGAFAGFLFGRRSRLEEEAGDWYESEATGERTFITVNAGKRDREARSLMMSFGAVEVGDRYEALATDAQRELFTEPYMQRRTDEVYQHTTGFRDSAVAATREEQVPTPISPRLWKQVMPGFRNRWQADFATRGGDWEVYEPYYRYSWEMYLRPEYSGRSWEEVERPLRQDWTSRHGDRPWEEASDLLRVTWGSVNEDAVREPERGSPLPDLDDRERAA